MTFYNKPSRAAYVAGVQAAFDTLIPELAAPEAREIEQWLLELRLWADGPPPLAPHYWPEAPALEHVGTLQDSAY